MEHEQNQGQAVLEGANKSEPIIFNLGIPWIMGSLQPGLTQPVALLLDETADTEKAANVAGFLFFTREADLRQHVETLELGAAPLAVGA